MKPFGAPCPRHPLSLIVDKFFDVPRFVCHRPLLLLLPLILGLLLPSGCVSTIRTFPCLGPESPGLNVPCCPLVLPGNGPAVVPLPNPVSPSFGRLAPDPSGTWLSEEKTSTGEVIISTTTLGPESAGPQTPTLFPLFQMHLGG